MKVVSVSVRTMTLAALLLLPVLAACAPPGKAVCQRFDEAAARLEEGESNIFEFRKEVVKVQEKARSAELRISRAAANLVHASDAVSGLRLEVAIEAMSAACVAAGYLEPARS